MVEKSEIERAIAQLTKDYHSQLSGSAAEIYLEGQLVALKWVMSQGMWVDVGESVRQAKHQALQNEPNPKTRSGGP